LVLKKKKVRRISAELRMYGKSETTKSSFRFEIIANAAKVIPIEKDPVLPTNILPLKFRKASTSQTANGPYNMTAFEPETIINPIIIIAGQTVSKPFSPPS
jgi:hypothetical protein